MMSLVAKAMVAASRAVKAPIMATVVMASADASNTGKKRAIRNTPAATIVAAWMRALTGVGPSMASGSHTCSGNCADLPTAPQKMPMANPVADSPPSTPKAAPFCMSPISRKLRPREA